MTHRAKDWDMAVPRPVRSHTGRPIPAVARSLALIAALFLLPACSGPMGNMFAGLLGAGAMYGGQSFLNRAEEDVTAKIAWRIRKREYVAIYSAGILREARVKAEESDYEGWREAMVALLEFHDTQHPETLIMELGRRAKERSGG